jgi:hypothetical protein
VGSVAARSDGETYELAWIFDVRFLADEPYHGLTPLQRSKHCPCACEEAPASLNGLLKKLASKVGQRAVSEWIGNAESSVMLIQRTAFRSARLCRHCECEHRPAAAALLRKGKRATMTAVPSKQRSTSCPKFIKPRAMAD